VVEFADKKYPWWLKLDRAIGEERDDDDAEARFK
jgi:hypothetical protein